jgi:hypothetical protein
MQLTVQRAEEILSKTRDVAAQYGMDEAVTYLKQRLNEHGVLKDRFLFNVILTNTPADMCEFEDILKDFNFWPL